MCDTLIFITEDGRVRTPNQEMYLKKVEEQTLVLHKIITYCYFFYFYTRNSHKIIQKLFGYES